MNKHKALLLGTLLAFAAFLYLLAVMLWNNAERDVANWIIHQRAEIARTLDEMLYEHREFIRNACGYFFAAFSATCIGIAVRLVFAK